MIFRSAGGGVCIGEHFATQEAVPLLVMIAAGGGVAGGRRAGTPGARDAHVAAEAVGDAAGAAGGSDVGASSRAKRGTLPGNGSSHSHARSLASLGMRSEAEQRMFTQS